MLIGLFLLINISCQKAVYTKKYNYTLAKQQVIEENYHGTIVKDPYRWLEDLESPETRAWIEAQIKFTSSYLSGISKRGEIVNRLTELYNYPRYRGMIKRGDYYYFYKNDGLQNQYVLYRQKGLTGEPEMIIDPNKLSEDGTVAISNLTISKDGTHIVYALSAKGSDQQELRIKNVESGKDYDEIIKWCKFTSIAWVSNNEGFYYNRYPEPGTVPKGDENKFNKVYWHKLGTNQEDDILIYERADAKELMFQPLITEDEKYLILQIYKGTDPTNRVYYKEIDSKGDFIRLLDKNDAEYSFLGNEGKIFYFKTDLNSPRAKIIAIDIDNPEESNWKVIIPEKEEPIDYARIINNKFVILYLKDVVHKLEIYDLNGKYIKEIELPTIGSIAEITGRQNDNIMIFSFSSFLYPGTIFQYDFEEDNLEIIKEAKIKFNVNDYESKQIFYNSKDGTKVPMFIIQKKGIKLDGNNPVLLYGYGGFNVKLSPYFSVYRLVWLENGGVYAIANLRGGSEYGEDWHRAGMLENKQNVFDDFISAAEWLINNKYTNPSKLAIEGGSNGGLLVAASMLQRPDLFKAVICEVPVTDMLRYHKFTVGHYWTGEYGNAEENKEHFKFLYAYSPLHNVKANVNYPSIMVTSADTDDRVYPAHALKFVATLQAASTGNNLVLLRFETKAGHGAGKPLSKIINEVADLLAFAFNEINM